ncbi:MAG: choice-of-anchor D domain-containing protein [Flavobacterium sp.]|uniref:choice-of-anchor D domain-containing protein n=1 Tax=Flavobacterium sp. TaxID=239 RepID=UPI001222F893|nr:choice-of-anchor D domain-containing protein [Flavobacterium sp.]RZJ67738.1 MAG: choice-of-anchor D domain-containing protein [Flavobacterium sp.]
MENFTQLAKKLSLLVLFLLIGNEAFSQSPQTFDTTNTWTVPAGVTSVTVQAWGGGGHGASRTSNGRGGGGGGGAYAVKVVAVTPGDVLTVNVGGGATDDNAGGDSWFIDNTIVLAKGGASAPDNSNTNGVGGSLTLSIGDDTNSGGNGANGGTNSGGGGSSAGTAAAGNGANANNQTGGNAPTGGGDGGNGRASNGNGQDGDVPGGGGGGGYKSSGTSTRFGGDGGNGRVILTWTAAAVPEINVQGAGANIANADATPTAADNTDFGTTDVTSGTIQKVFTIQNTGAGALTIGAITFTGATADFSITTAPAATVASGVNTTFTVTFNPTALGIRTAVISIANNDSDEAPYYFTIQGNGGDPDMSVLGNGVVITDNDLSPSVADDTSFGTTDIASGTIVKTFTITNTLASGTILNLGAITFTGGAAADFTVTSAPATSIAPGASTTFQVTFNPSATGVRTTSLNIATNDLNTPIYNFNIEGTGGDPEINIQGNGINIVINDSGPSTADGTDFGAVNIIGATSATQTFVIQNTGSAPLNITGVTITGGQAGDFTVTTPPATTVAPGASTSFVVTFNPSATGIRTTVIYVANNDSNENPYNFTIRGTGNNPDIAVSGNGNNIAMAAATPVVTNNTEFGTVSVTGGTVTRMFTISNTLASATTLNIGAITFTGAAASDFTVSTPPAATVVAGGTTNFYVTFDPSTNGLRQATLYIANNDSDENPYYFNIQGTGGEPEINVQGNSTNIPDGDLFSSTADGTNFGTWNVVGNTSDTHTFTIQNTGLAALIISGITITGANAGDFTVGTAPAATVAPGGSTTFTIIFNPSATGIRTATVNIANNDANEANYDFVVQGTGNDPEINVTGAGNTIPTGSNAPVITNNTDFGTTDVTAGTIVRSFTISNALLSGTQLTLGTITISGAAAADFTVTATPAATVNAGATTTFSVTFNPSVAGLRTAVISIPNNDSDESPYTFAVQGNGADPEINIQGNGIDIVDGDTTPSTADGTNMGTVAVIGATTSTQTFYIYNLASATMPLTISGVTITGTNAADFSITNAPAASVAVGGVTSFTVTFNPSASGARNATINVANNDGNENPYNYNVQGTGVDPEINLQGNAVSIVDGDTTPATADWTDFGATTVTGGTITRTFTISNQSTGTAPLDLGAITVTGANAADFTVTQPATTTLAVNSSVTFTVTFDPIGTGTRNATINIPNNDSNESPYDFAVRGFGNEPEMEITGNTLTISDGDNTPSVSDNTDFGTVSIDSGSTFVTFVIRNTGVGPLSIGGISFAGPDASNFSVSLAPASSVAQGGTTTFQVSFNPLTIGTKTATIYVINDDSDENPYNYIITGLGVRTYADTDGDGITDNIDIDDDNDGIIDTLDQSNCAASAFAGSIEHTFLNETFGAGTTKGQININIPGATCSYCFEDGVVQPNTTACPNQSSGILDDGEYVVVHRIANTTSGHPDNIHYDLAWNGFEDHTTGDTYGRMAVFNASYAPQVFYETTISGVMPNVPITYSFWALNILSSSVYNNSILPNITVEFRDMSNNLISSYNTGDIGRCTAGNSNNSCTASEWRQYTTSVNLGNLTSFIIRFRNNAPGGNGNDLALDDITIKQNYCDRDFDGIGNIFDLDSDNDGIPDIEEAGFVSLSGGKGIMDLTGGTWADTNGNGLHDNIDAMISGGTYLLPDTDGDSVRNFQDLDSDNDSLFDVDEAGLANGDGDVEGNGVGDGIDTDKDGILDVWDTVTGYGTAVRPSAQNTDGLGNPDYMQIDSDGIAPRDIQTSLYANLDTNNDGVIDGNLDADKDGILDNFDTKATVLGSPRDLDRKLYLYFDGRNDYAIGEQLLSSLPSASMMSWIKLTDDVSTDTYTSEGVIMGQSNFMLRVNGSRQVVANIGGVTLTYNVALDVDRWYHIAATYDSSLPTQKLKLFVNGTMVTSANNTSLGSGLTASTTPLTLGKSPSYSTLYFKGAIDEARVFNNGLTVDQVQKMVYQEIQANGSAIRGEFIPKDIESTSWTSLIGYYRMDVFKNDVIDNYITSGPDIGTSSTFARIYNVKTIRYQLAPLPFTTTLAGSLDTAVSQNNFVNGPDVFNVPWSIVDVRHNINLPVNQTSLGMIIKPGTTVNLTNDNKLENSWYLKLDGKLDLQGKSQLVQTQFSDLAANSIGYIERDQQGTANKFNYNYWGSPVGSINATTNNNSYTVNSVLRDGTNPANPQNLLWTTGYNSSATSPITLSSYWIYKFQNTSNSYSNWVAVGQNGTLLAGQGFTLKGSSAISEKQNYVFVGKPNNGTITMPVGPNNLNLAGNPYASAIDANAFLTANAAVIQGSLSFWEHFTTNSSHVTAAYQGGYAYYSIVGGVPPVAHPDASGLGSSTKTPKRFIPVGQGFFVKGNATGGTITFNNAQRAFIKEDNATSYSMFRQTAATSEPKAVGNEEDIVARENIAYKKVRLGYNFVNGFHRQILLGFMDTEATPDYDPGYDAEYFDNYPDEMVFKSGTRKFTIQGDGYFNVNNSYPLNVKSGTAGTVKFTLDDTENLDASQPVYIFDAQTGIYHNLRDGAFTFTTAATTYGDRFFLRFTDQVGMINKDVPSESVAVAYDEQISELAIRNEIKDVTVTKATMYNMLGQYLAEFDVTGQEQTNIRIPLKNIASGTYILKMESNGGSFSQKVIIK